MTRLFLIHAFAGAMKPVQEALAAGWPEAQAVNLLDESLSVDRARQQELSPELYQRIATLAHHAQAAGADAILYTCSAFGPAVDAVAAALPLPVLKPNQAMFEAALRAGRRIGMIATDPAAVESMAGEFRDLAVQGGVDADLSIVLVPEARAALLAGDPAEHHRLVTEAARRMGQLDALMLAHFSMAPAAVAVRAGLDQPGSGGGENQTTGGPERPRIMRSQDETDL
jgi:Asp/Glu/hydantoin racemase